jgi:hypothetical protein
MELWQDIQNESKTLSSRVKNSAGNIDNRIIVTELVRAMDFTFAVVSFMIDQDSEKDEDQRWRKSFHLQSTGFYSALRLFFNDEVNKSGFELFSMDQRSLEWAYRCLNNMGNIGYLERFLSVYRSGMVRLEKVSEQEVRFILPKEGGYEQIERVDIEWVRDKLINEDNYNPTSQEIDYLLKEKVRVWRKYFIEYDSDPVIDNHYDQYGKKYGSWLMGKDDFLSTSVFNGVAYEDYRNVLITLIGWTLQHKDFCNKLTEENKTIKLWDIYTQPVYVDLLIKKLSAYLQMNKETIEKILDTLTLSPENMHFFADHPGGPPPPFIKIGNKHLLQSMMGLLSNPFFFLNRMLREQFINDYSIASNEREIYFRNELYGLFNNINIHKCHQTVNLKKENKIITDIDAMLFDAKSSSLILFQLKWMEPFANNMNERYSRGKNFIDRATKWVEVLSAWLIENNPAHLLSFFELNNNFEVKEVRLIVIGRYYSSFSKKDRDPRSAWGNWYQILRLIKETPQITVSLKDFYKSLSDDIPSNKSISIKETEAFQVGKYKITLCSE